MPAASVWGPSSPTNQFFPPLHAERTAVLHYTTLHCIVRQYNTLHYAPLQYNTLHCTVQCSTPAGRRPWRPNKLGMLMDCNWLTLHCCIVWYCNVQCTDVVQCSVHCTDGCYSAVCNNVLQCSEYNTLEADKMEMLPHLSSVKQLWAFLSASLPNLVCYGWETRLGKPFGNRHSTS